VVVLLLFGFVELGWYVNNVQILHNAARQGARAAVRLENSNAEVRAAVLSSLDGVIDVDPSAVTVQMMTVTQSGYTDYHIMNLNENEQGRAIRVAVSVQYDQVSLPVDFFGLGVV